MFDSDQVKELLADPTNKIDVNQALSEDEAEACGTAPPLCPLLYAHAARLPQLPRMPVCPLVVGAAVPLARADPGPCRRMAHVGAPPALRRRSLRSA